MPFHHIPARLGGSGCFDGTQCPGSIVISGCTVALEHNGGMRLLAIGRVRGAGVARWPLAAGEATGVGARGVLMLGKMQ